MAAVTNDDTPFCWGILGVARINRALLAPLRTGRHRLLAVASRTAARADAYAAEHGIPRAYGSYDALLADPDIDAVYIPVPNSLHAELAIRAAQAGKHVLCEKPLAQSADDVRAIAQAARQTGRVITEAFMYRHHPVVTRTRTLLAEGAIGRLLGVVGVFTFTLDRPHDVRFDPALGGGSLWDVGCYPVSFVRTVLGQRPHAVQGSAAWSTRGVDLTFFGQLHFQDGVVAQVVSSFESPFRTAMEFMGTEGRLRVPRPFKPHERDVVGLMRGDDIETIEVAGPPLYQGEVDDVADAARTGRPPLVTLDDSLDNTETLVALLESARGGGTVSLPGR